MFIRDFSCTFGYGIAADDAFGYLVLVLLCFMIWLLKKIFCYFGLNAYLFICLFVIVHMLIRTLSLGVMKLCEYFTVYEKI